MTIIDAASEVPRDRFDRPMVVPVDGGKLVPYTRCTTYVGCLEDTFNLGQWQQRMVALGLSSRPDLLLAVAAHHDDKDRMNKLCGEAREAAAASAGATTGTALHTLTERLDRGQPLGMIPDAYRPDLDAYEDATSCLTATHIEQFSVCDELEVGGTPDRIVELDGAHYIADVKTGSIEYGIGKIAMQLAVYAHSVGYDVASTERFDLPDLNHDRALVIHLPAGTGRCELVWVDIAAGWEAVKIATEVRQWRKRAKFKTLTRPFVVESSTPKVEQTERSLNPTNLDDRIAEADSVETLTRLWTEHRDEWTSEHTQLAAARKSLLATNAVAS